MISVLIPTKPDDAHAILVKLALEKKGHAATLWYTADFPEQQTHSFEFSGNEIVWRAKGVEFQVDECQQHHVVWLRRPRKPMLPAFLHEDDVDNARNENNEFFKTIWQVILPNAFWINPVNRLTSVGCKLLQLKVAKEVGFNIPDSLFTNDPEKIRSFIGKYEKNRVIYKPIFPVYWVGEDYLRLTYTQEMNDDLLTSNKMLQSTPGIYQEKIEKDFELRVTYFGDKAIAVKLHSQAHPDAKTDWRSVPCFEIDIEAFDLPAHIDKQCRAFMQKMGIVFGCFDLIVTPDHQYYFLEINEQGQFLWIEETNPDIKMLDAFTNFLVECGGGKVDDRAPIVSLADLNDDMEAVQKKAITLHKDSGLLV